MMVELALFTAQCRGVKFYSLAEMGAKFGSEVEFVRRPFLPRDSNCVEVGVKVKGRYKKLGQLAAEAAEWLSALGIFLYLWVSYLHGFISCLNAVEY